MVGGLYGLNLIPLFRPAEVTFFDINPHAVAFFNLIRRVWIDSSSAEEFLDRLKTADYDANTDQERVIRNCLAARQRGTLTEDRGQSARSLLSRLALCPGPLRFDPANPLGGSLQHTSGCDAFKKFSRLRRRSRESLDLLLQCDVILVLRPHLPLSGKRSSICRILRNRQRCSIWVISATDRSPFTAEYR